MVAFETCLTNHIYQFENLLFLQMIGGGIVARVEGRRGAAGSDGRVKYKQEAMRQEVRNMVL